MSGALGSMGADERAKFDNSNVAKGMEGVLGATSEYFGTLGVKNGTLTSTQARQAVDSAGKNIKTGGTTDAFSKLLQENAKLQADFAREKATRTKVEADLSIADQRLAGNGSETVVNNTQGTGGADAPTGTEGATGTSATAEQLDSVSPLTNEDGTVDPIVQALADAQNERQAIVNQKLDAMAAFVDAEDDDSQKMIDNIRATADAQAKRVEKENARLAQAARVAGVVAGRGMYSPEEHEGIISEVIQDGYARIAEIESTRDMAVLEAKKAQREFRYKAFVEASDMVQALSEMKQQTIVDMANRISQVEKDQREKMKFDQEQADRTSFIIAPELQGATPEEIYAAALANNIEPGALMREVQAYKDEQEMLDLDKTAAQESINATRESIKSSQLDRQLTNIKIKEALNPAPEKADPMTKSELEVFANGIDGEGGFGWVPPQGMTYNMAVAIEAEYQNEPASTRRRIAEEQLLKVDRANPGQISTEIGDYVNNTLGGDEVTVNSWKKALGIGKDEDLFTSQAFINVVRESEFQDAINNTQMTTEKKYEKLVWLMNKKVSDAAEQKKAALDAENKDNPSYGATQEELDAAAATGKFDIQGRATGNNPYDQEDRSKLTL